MSQHPLDAVVAEVVQTGAVFTVMKHGMPVAVVIRYAEYEALMELLDAKRAAKTVPSEQGKSA